jgi:hypothetical protein
LAEADDRSDEVRRSNRPGDHGVGTGSPTGHGSVVGSISGGAGAGIEGNVSGTVSGSTVIRRDGPGIVANRA